MFSPLEWRGDYINIARNGDTTLLWLFWGQVSRKKLSRVMKSRIGLRKQGKYSVYSEGHIPELDPIPCFSAASLFPTWCPSHNIKRYNAESATISYYYFTARVAAAAALAVPSVSSFYSPFRDVLQHHMAGPWEGKKSQCLPSYFYTYTTSKIYEPRSIM